jgi:hypothetical protein
MGSEVSMGSGWLMGSIRQVVDNSRPAGARRMVG